MLQVVSVLLMLLLVTQVEVALYSANTLLSKVSLIGEEPTLKEKVALMLQPAYILKGETLPHLSPYPPPPPTPHLIPPHPSLLTLPPTPPFRPPGSFPTMLSPPRPMTRHWKACK